MNGRVSRRGVLPEDRTLSCDPSRSPAFSVYLDGYNSFSTRDPRNRISRQELQSLLLSTHGEDALDVMDFMGFEEYVSVLQILEEIQDEKLYPSSYAKESKRRKSLEEKLRIIQSEYKDLKIRYQTLEEQHKKATEKSVAQAFEIERLNTVVSHLQKTRQSVIEPRREPRKQEFQEVKDSSERRDDFKKEVPPSENHDGLEEEIISDMIFGMQKAFAVEQINKGPKRQLTASDFSEVLVWNGKRRPDEVLRFKTFSPKVFEEIREQFQVTPQEIIDSFDWGKFKTIKGEGKSGAFLLLSKDNRFVIKTATKKERDVMWDLLPSYCSHIAKNPDTLIPRIYAMFGFRHSGDGGWGCVRFLVQNNVFGNGQFPPKERYDLKGSTYGRSVPLTDRDKVTTLKDQDILDARRKFFIAEDTATLLKAQITRDVNYLAKQDLMDYSLLVGIHYPSPSDPPSNVTSPPPTQFLSKFQKAEGALLGHNVFKQTEERYYIGIIDILTKYGSWKSAETFFKSFSVTEQQLSSVPAPTYAARFINFMNDLIVPIPASLTPRGIMMTTPIVGTNSTTKTNVPTIPIEGTSTTPIVGTNGNPSSTEAASPRPHRPTLPPLTNSAGSSVGSTTSSSSTSNISRSNSISSPTNIPYQKSSAFSRLQSPYSMVESSGSEYYTQQRHRKSQQLQEELTQQLQNEVREYQELRQQRIDEEWEKRPSVVLLPIPGRNATAVTTTNVAPTSATTGVTPSTTGTSSTNQAQANKPSVIRRMAGLFDTTLFDTTLFDTTLFDTTLFDSTGDK
eukprot:TRINITY_DN2889_c0_g1_i1.p1 TRINITY_DN2889_c0_g1~~TRINITY_DN2889_c0_g1_i1.p1  ORF type:complete len:790 (+),score=138.34 TRINITY_DN2889_c0_g1_i1:39-2408(+)